MSDRVVTVLYVSSPRLCPAGHELGAYRVLVGWASCSSDTHGHGHRTRFCLECHRTVYDPPLDGTCELKTGPDER